MRTYSLDLRQRVLAAWDLGEMTQVEVAEQFQVSRQWLVRLLARRRETGSVAALPHGGGWTPKFSGPRLAALQAAVTKERLGCHRKKSRCGPPSRTGRT
jgi:transposase